MKRFVLKGVVFSTLFALFLMFSLSSFKANASNSFQPTEDDCINLFDKYILVLEFERGSLEGQPKSWWEMYDITCGANMNWSDSDVFLYCYNLMSDYLSIYEHVYDNAMNIISSETINSYNQGYTVGLDDGFNNGFSDGYNNGVLAGYSQYESDKGSSLKLKELIFSVFDAPFNVIRNALNFEIFGINLSSLILFFISLGLVGFVIRLFLKG